MACGLRNLPEEVEMKEVTRDKLMGVEIGIKGPTGCGGAPVFPGATIIGLYRRAEGVHLAALGGRSPAKRR